MQVAIYSWNAHRHIEAAYMKSTAATDLYVWKWLPHTNPPRSNRGKIQSVDY